MKRIAISPRVGWEKIVEEQGLVWHTVDGVPYWNESAYYEFTAAEIDKIEKATVELQRIYLAAGDFIIANSLFDELGIPPVAVPLIKAAWEAEPAALYHGRFDLAYDGSGPPKLLEYNADTPTSLFEAAVVQWSWKEQMFSASDQFNSLHERLVAKWKDIKPYLGTDRVHFTHINDDAGEDTITVTYLRDTAEQAGLSTAPVVIQDIGWEEKNAQFVDAQSEPIRVLFHLYPWEWLLADSFGQHIPQTADKMLWIEPIWKMMWSTKAILPILWRMFPNHPNLLPAYADQHGMANYVRKPRLSREGANITVVEGGKVVTETPGKYGGGPFVFQERAVIQSFDGNHPILGSWIVDGEPAGMGVREGGIVTGNTSRFVPHIIRF